jgi:hypothetical protein
MRNTRPGVWLAGQGRVIEPSFDHHRSRPLLDRDVNPAPSCDVEASGEGHEPIVGAVTNSIDTCVPAATTIMSHLHQFLPDAFVATEPRRRSVTAPHANSGEVPFGSGGCRLRRAPIGGRGSLRRAHRQRVKPSHPAAPYNHLDNGMVPMAEAMHEL